MLMWVMNLDFAASETDAPDPIDLGQMFLTYPWVWDEWRVT
jgi:hypothetical protein